MPQSAPTIFINYRRDDSPGHAGRLYDALVRRFGREQVFQDVSGIPPGVQFDSQILQSLTSCRVFLVVIGKSWLEPTSSGRRIDDPKDFVRREIITALSKPVRIVPVLVQGTSVPKEAALPESLRPLTSWNASELSDTRWEHDVARLMDAIAADVLEPVPERDTTLDLKSAHEHQRQQLARDRERHLMALTVVEAVPHPGGGYEPGAEPPCSLLEEMLRHQRVWLIGKAGSGKSTVLRTVVVAHLDSASLCLDIRLDGFRADPTRQPVESLLSLISTELEDIHATSHSLSPKEVQKLLRDRRILLLLDGLDEVAPEAQPSCVSAIRRLTELLPEVACVVATRPRQFRAPEGWQVVLMQEPTEEQTREFLAALLAGRNVPVASQLLSKSPLLRLPLFLYLTAERLRNGKNARVGSRSGLLRDYVDDLLDGSGTLSPGEPSPAHLSQALSWLAEKASEQGQMLIPLSEACAVLERPGASTVAPGRTLEELCERGFLLREGQNVRFWHKILQDYFLAAALVTQWRASRRRPADVSGWLRRTRRKARYEEALVYSVAHFREEELAPMVSKAMDLSPSLPLEWIQDLVAEGRGSAAVESFVERIHRRLASHRRWSMVGRILWPIAAMVTLMGAIWNIEPAFVVGMIVTITGFLGSRALRILQFLWFGPLLRTHVHALRERLVAAIARDGLLRHRGLSSPDLGTLTREDASGSELLEVVTRSDNAANTLYLLGYAPASVARLLLEHASELPQYRETALVALAERASWEKAEKEHFVQLVKRRQWDTEPDPFSQFVAKGVLLGSDWEQEDRQKAMLQAVLSHAGLRFNFQQYWGGRMSEADRSRLERMLGHPPLPGPASPASSTSATEAEHTKPRA